MTRDDALRILRAEQDAWRREYGVKSLALFGSVARNEASPVSDVDLLVEFESPPGFDGYMALKFRLEEVLRCRVDLVMRPALKAWAEPVVVREAIRVA
jgi:uncharacterized protein